MDNKNYVLGFAFNDYQVLLIEKQKPAWQKGLYNGLGGHIEKDETPIAAMVREFKEECGIDTNESDWELYAEMKGDDWDCKCFRALNTFALCDAKKTTSEEPKTFHCMGIEEVPTISNVPALIFLARDIHNPTITTLDYTTKK